MSINSRSKGQRGEREVIDMLQPVVNQVYRDRGRASPLLERNLMQSSNGGHDIVGLRWLALEVKFCETLHIDDWWQQTIDQASKVNAIPVLIYRKSRVKWRVRMYGLLNANHVHRNSAGKIPTLGGKIACPVEVSLEAFMTWFEATLKESLDLDN